MATIESFCEKPSGELLEQFTKEQLLQLAIEYDTDISNADKRLKKTIIDAIKTELVARGVLPSPPDGEFVLPISPVSLSQ